MVEFDWNRFQRPETSRTETEEKEEEKKPFSWGNFQTPSTFQENTNDENAFEYITRNLVANASRVGEQVLGKYGNIEKFTTDALTNMPALLGIPGLAISELLGPEKWENLIRGSQHKQMLPTSQQLKEASQKATGGYTAPKTKGEKAFQELTEDVAAIFRPSGSFFNNFVTPAASNAVKNFVDWQGLGEDKAQLAKLATNISMYLTGNVNGNQFAASLTNRGRNGIPEGAQFNVQRLEDNLGQLNFLTNDPRTSLARQQINLIRNDLANGQTDLRCLLNTYDGINAAKRDRGLFELGRGDRNYARAAIDEVLGVVRNEIREAGRVYPQAIQDWTNGMRAWSVIHRSNGVRNTIEDWARGPYAKILTGPATALFGLGGYATRNAPYVGIGVSAAIPAAYKGLQTAFRVWNDPNLANYYWNAISAAAQDNAPLFLKNYVKLNDKLKKSEPNKVKHKND